MKKEITIYSIIAAAIAEAVSLPVFGPNIFFPYGLAIGACASVISLNIISSTIEKAIEKGRKAPVIVGLVTRIVLYLAALYLAATTAPLSALGAAIGLLLPHLVIYVRFALRPAIRWKMGKDPKHTYVTDMRSNIFIKEPWIVRYNKGKAYMTHRHYRKARVDSK